MKTKTVASIAQMLGLIFVVATSQSFAQDNPPEYYQLGQAKATLYRPESGPPPHVDVVAMHRTANFLAYIGCMELSKRGFLALCMNPRFDNNETQVNWEQMPLDVAAGVNFLKKQPGITKVLLWGQRLLLLSLSLVLASCAARERAYQTDLKLGKSLEISAEIPFPQGRCRV